MSIQVPCPNCADGFVSPGDRHARTAQDVCRTCGGTHMVPARTGETPEASFQPGAEDATIPAITVWQPWATLIVLGAKPYEFRGWAAPKAYHGRRIAIHAGARPVRRSEVADLLLRLRGPEAWTTCLRPEIAIPILERIHAAPGAAVLSHVVGTAVLGEPAPSWQIVGEFGGVISDSDRAEHCNFAWPLADIVPAEPPVPAKGAQGFWPWRQEAFV